MVDFSSLFGRGISSAPFVFPEFDADAQAYIDAVEAADGQILEIEVARAIARFVKGCKTDGTWTAIKACCILAGAKTLAGALVPLVGAAPTNINFISSNYNRKTGLVGNGTSRYLNSNRANNADPQDNKHLAVYAFTASSSATAWIGSLVRSPSLSVSQIFHNTESQITGGINTGTQSDAAYFAPTGFIGFSRGNATEQSARINNITTEFASSSNSNHTLNTLVFARNDAGTVNSRSNGRISFYSIGESLNLALLDARVSALMTDFNSYIP
jgi:hypothetical protein